MSETNFESWKEVRDVVADAHELHHLQLLDSLEPLIKQHGLPMVLESCWEVGNKLFGTNYKPSAGIVQQQLSRVRWDRTSKEVIEHVKAKMKDFPEVQAKRVRKRKEKREGKRVS